MVQKILDEFRAGRRNFADFRIEMKGKFILMRYFAVRDREGAYRGCLEVSQDVTGHQETGRAEEGARLELTRRSHEFAQ